MFGIEHYPAFLAASAIFSITPGINMVFVMNKAVSGGRRAGFAAIAGIAAGNFVHTTLAALGVAMLLARWDAAYATVKWLGVGYMAYLGVSALWKTLLCRKNPGEEKESENNVDGVRPPDPTGPDRPAGNSGTDNYHTQTERSSCQENTFRDHISATEKPSEVSLRHHFLSGLGVNLLNPKIPLFFIAFFPQFISDAYKESPWPFFILGGTVIVLGTVCFSAINLFAGSLSDVISKNARGSEMMQVLTGIVFLILALTLAVTG